MRQLLFLILFISCFCSYAQENLAAKKSRFYLALDFSPIISYRRLIVKNGDPINIETKKYWKEVDKAKVGFKSGLNLGVHILPRLSAEIGIGLWQGGFIEKKTSYSREVKVDSFTFVMVDKNQGRTEHTFTYFSIPVSLGYTIRCTGLGLTPYIGLTENFLIKTAYHLHRNNTKQQFVGKGEKNLSVQAGIKVNYMIKKINFFINSQYSYSISHYSKWGNIRTQEKVLIGDGLYSYLDYLSLGAGVILNL